MDEEDEVTGWLAGVFTVIALPSLALVALQLIAAKALNFTGECFIWIGCVLTRLSYWLNDRIGL